MNTTTLKSRSLPYASASRGTPAGAALTARLAQWYDGLSRFVAPRVRTPAQEAAALRERAMRLLSTEPSFASDLLAAADQHEQDARR